MQIAITPSNDKNTKHAGKGFTLIELVVVIAIIGVLAGALIPTYMNYVESARNTAAIEEGRQVLYIFDLYSAEHNGVWPNTASAANDIIRGYFTGSEYPTISSSSASYSPRSTPRTFVMKASNGKIVEFNGSELAVAEE